MDNRSDLEVRGVDLNRIRNKNEIRVVLVMKMFLTEISNTAGGPTVRLI